MTDFWDEDDNVDYEAHYESLQREQAAATAERIGYPGMTEAFYRFGLYGNEVADEVFTPELLAAMDTWQVLLELAELTEDEPLRKELEREHETIDRAIHDMTDPRTHK
ncbi:MULTISPECIES: hypothetical protein [Paenarthrobacter]|uniref:Uncharacterized protein n=1 Tax=Paenarthrobacter nicotinovorans TaxID=29320 RepID=Q8GAB0_PAENI|nr:MULTISPECIES: hypothetical protein [Paenarthrobacter]MBP2396812.1 hypothetical protein [Paenarthrobacter nicotinovorans]CAD48021.1 hypothetical protein [Paenarthrobacter nicotinovorans]GGV40687.1 hypothetical protein GCM10010212_31820 [Paenarthrobacter nicotinovorans]GLU60957.1 hypothetical protein Pure01_34700 [Paenarthrobacter ureafaciens]GLU65227.1 hypothetical protein Pure02_34770 [Paenarthrobacter ureafaciens]